MKNTQVDKQEGTNTINTDAEEQFSENWRLTFSVAIIATFFVIPTCNALISALKCCIGISAFFAALFLIMTAATMKYKDPYKMYGGIISINEKLRRKMYDISVSVFGVFFLTALGLLTITLISEDFKNWTGTLPGTWPPAIWLAAGAMLLLVIKGITIIARTLVPKLRNKKK